MKVFVTGGTGLIGRALVKQLVNGGHQVTVLTRQFRVSESNIRYIQAISSLVERPDVVINLAGAGLADKRWTASYKREIRASRIGLTELLVAHLRVSDRVSRCLYQWQCHWILWCQRRSAIR